MAWSRRSSTWGANEWSDDAQAGGWSDAESWTWNAGSHNAPPSGLGGVGVAPLGSLTEAWNAYQQETAAALQKEYPWFEEADILDPEPTPRAVATQAGAASSGHGLGDEYPWCMFKEADIPDPEPPPRAAATQAGAASSGHGLGGWPWLAYVRSALDAAFTQQPDSFNGDDEGFSAKPEEIDEAGEDDDYDPIVPPGHIPAPGWFPADQRPQAAAIAAFTAAARGWPSPWLSASETAEGSGAAGDSGAAHHPPYKAHGPDDPYEQAHRKFLEHHLAQEQRESSEAPTPTGLGGVARQPLQQEQPLGPQGPQGQPLQQEQQGQQG